VLLLVVYDPAPGEQLGLAKQAPETQELVPEQVMPLQEQERA
jgi:hypothetical protein